MARFKESAVPTLIGLVVPLCCIAVVFAWNIAHTGYTGNQRLTEANSKLRQENNDLRAQFLEKAGPKDKEINRLKGQLLATCYYPDRHLTEQQKAHVFALLSKVARDFKKASLPTAVTIGAVSGDKEAQNFMADIRHQFVDAGWTVNYPKNYQEQQDWIQRNAGTIGIIVLDKGTKINPGMLVGSIFGHSDLGFDVSALYPNQVKDAKELDDFTVWVGYKNNVWKNF